MHHNMVLPFSSHLERFLIGLAGTTDSFFGTSLFRPAALLGGFAYLGVPKLLTGAETPLVRSDVKDPEKTITHLAALEYRPRTEEGL